MKAYEFKIDSDTLEASLIVPTPAEVAAAVSARIAQDHDGKVRAALIGMGWTPPGDKSVHPMGLTGARRDEVARILEIAVRDGFPGPRDLDACLDAIEQAYLHTPNF